MKKFTRALLCGDLQRVSHVFRYSSRPVIARETVAEHSFYVALYAYFIAETINEDIDFKKLLTRAIIHDLDESITGDFQRAFKYSSVSLREEIAKAARLFITKMLEPFSNASRILMAWDNAKADDIEGDIIKIADFLAVAAYIIKETKMGNNHLRHIIQECIAYGNDIKTRVDHNKLIGIIDETNILLMGVSYVC